MSMVRPLCLLLLVMSLVPCTGSADDRSVPGTARSRADILHQIRRDKLDLILPAAMRDNRIDMWIHVVREGDPDPLEPHFGSAWGYLIFTDRGGDRIERALFGGGGHPDLFDGFGSEELSMTIAGYFHGQEPADAYEEISKFIAERDPKVIAVNNSAWLAVADGMSYSERLKLERILGGKYLSRTVSAEHLITDFCATRTQSEVNAFAHALEMHRQLLVRALSREVITPGVTTLADVGWWVEEQKDRLGISHGVGAEIDIPRILYSAASTTSEPPDVRWLIHRDDYVIQRGDFMTFDISVRYLDYFTTDYKLNAYVMREGEDRIPGGVQTAFDRAIAAQRLMRGHIVAGRTAKQTLDRLVEVLESSGYVYTPFTDIGVEDYKAVQKALSGIDAPGFSIDLHAVGNHGGSLVTVGASVAPFRKDRFDLLLRDNQFFSFEFMVHSNLPERPGFPVSINIEGNHLLTARGVEYLHPPNEAIVRIH